MGVFANNQAEGAHQRRYWLDVARAIAIVSITFNHALNRSFEYYRGGIIEFSKMSSVAAFIKAILYVFSRIGVPLFLMITGSLLMDRRYDEKPVLNKFIKHNWWGLFRTTEIWLVIMFCYMQCYPSGVLRNEGPVAALIGLLKTVFFIDQITLQPIWYMQMIICVYLMIPIVAMGLQKLDHKLFYVICLIAIVSSMVFPNINTALKTLGTEKTFEFALSITDLFSIYFIYILVGYWISHGKLQAVNDFVLYVVFIVSFLATSAFQFWIYMSDGLYHVRYADIGVLIAGAALFEIIRRKADRIKAVSRPVTYLSKISFGIYFVHICIMMGVNAAIQDKIIMYPKFFILEITSFVLSIVIIRVVSICKPAAHYLFLIKD